MNLARKHAQGQRFLRLAGLADVAAARDIWKDPNAPVSQRCLSARALGLLAEHGAQWMVAGVEEDDSPLDRARIRAQDDVACRLSAERRGREIEEGVAKMGQLGVASQGDVIAILRERAETPPKRQTAVFRGRACEQLPASAASGIPAS